MKKMFFFFFVMNLSFALTEQELRQMSGEIAIYDKVVAIKKEVRNAGIELWIDEVWFRSLKRVGLSVAYNEIIEQLTYGCLIKCPNHETKIYKTFDELGLEMLRVMETKCAMVKWYVMRNRVLASREKVARLELNLQETKRACEAATIKQVVGDCILNKQINEEKNRENLNKIIYFLIKIHNLFLELSIVIDFMIMREKVLEVKDVIKRLELRKIRKDFVEAKKIADEYMQRLFSYIWFNDDKENTVSFYKYMTFGDNVFLICITGSEELGVYIANEETTCDELGNIIRRKMYKERDLFKCLVQGSEFCFQNVLAVVDFDGFKFQEDFINNQEEVFLGYSGLNEDENGEKIRLAMFIEFLRALKLTFVTQKTYETISKELINICDKK